MTTAACLALTSRTFSVKYLGVVFILALLPLFFSTAVSAKTDAALFTQIDSLRQIAGQIQIDGNGSDWIGIPAFTDPEGDAGGDGSRDVVGFAIAPRVDDILFLITTAGIPSLDNLAFTLELDFMGRWPSDVKIGIAPTGAHTLEIIQENGGEQSTIISGLQVAIGSVMEIRIPYASLVQALPPDMGFFLTGQNFRSFIRARVRTFSNPQSQLVDTGPEVASYRLVQTPYSLATPPALSEIFVELPLNGKWFVGQGGFSNGGSHFNIWAYDLNIRDINGNRSNPPNSPNLEDYYDFGRSVYAPQTSRVLETYNASPDGSPLSNPPLPLPPNNRVLLSLDSVSGLALALLHFKQSTVRVSVGETVVRGEALALVGDSGNSGAPHLHMQFQNYPDTQTSPMALANVRVSLNATPDDPWTRDMATWQVSESFFVERMSPFGTTAGDFDGDGKSELTIYRGGAWLVQDAVTGALKKAVWTGGLSGEIPTPGDYDGDGVTDLSSYRNGAWLFFDNTTGALVRGIWTGGAAGDIPVPGDYDGDGKTDIGIYRGGAWLIYDAFTGALKKAVWTGALPGEIPTPGDYNGDGITDLASYRSGAWLIFDNATGALARGIWTGGVVGDIPVAGDYDGDGKTDIAIYRAGAWLIQDNVTGALKKAVWTGALSGEKPTPGDYDGDGITDLSSYRNGAWLIFNNATGALLRGIWTGGVTGEIPVSTKVPLN